MKISLIILTFVLLTSCQTNGKEKQENFFELSTKIDSIISENKFNGVVSLSTDSIDIYSKSFGFSDLENKVRININDQFVIGSISKQITAVLILREYEKGKVGLNDKIGNYLTEINQPWTNDVTIHQLLTHTHGIVDLDKPLEFKQGSQFHYSQLGYELLAQILQKVTGKTFKDLSTELFNQYGLKNTSHPNNKGYKNLVKGYEESENGILEYTEHSLENYAAAGSFISNVEDLKKWNQLLYSEKLVKKETLELMKTKYSTRIHPIFDTIDYGYGLLFKDGEQSIQIGALGYAPGFVSACYYYPQTKLNLVILENTANNLDDFKKTFIVQTEIMELIKNQT
ncbi:serine hydrolase domain-containing protein [Mariniflexile sp. HMF6888]|uniref:serine hydrolase domain-containing protein n=1 Tax=Mariniflexile sp. HMF6888 TaxID=3373086 RepID=UPI00379259BC